jgi:hypothetical protein
MVKSLLNNKPPLQQQNIFTNQSKNQNRKTARGGNSREVGQDKGHYGNAPHKADEPAPFAKRSGARAVNTKTVQLQKTKTGREKLIHSTVHYEPRVHAELKRLAEEQRLSFSEVCNAAGRFYVTATIEKQHAEVLRDVLRHIIREELQVFGNRLVYFLMRIAFSTEQAKLLITNVLKFVLKLSGLTEKTYLTLVDESGKMAKRNILANTPQIKDLFAQWETKERKEGAGR